MNFIKQSVSAVLIMFVAVTAINAQAQQQPAQTASPDSVSDQELRQFARITDSARTIRQDVQQQVQDLVQEHDMEFNRFQKIMMSRQNPQSSGQVETTAEEEQKLKEIQPELMKINKEAQQEFVQLIQEEGFTPQRFQQVMRAVQMNAELQQRLQEVQGSDG